MRQIHNVSMTVVANKIEVLEKLKANRARHAEIVKEAREGYFKLAEETLTQALMDLRNTKPTKLTQVAINLRPPVDHTREYNTVIAMLELHVEDTIPLTADEVRQFVEDDWDWMREFLSTNAAYSGLARELDR